MRHAQGGHAHFLVEHRHGLIVLDRKDIDVAQLYELAPRAVCLQKLCHARHGSYARPIRTQRLPSEVHETRVMPHVGVGEENGGGLRNA